MITSRFYEIVNSMNLKERRKEEDKEECTMHGVLRVEVGKGPTANKQTNLDKPQFVRTQLKKV